VVPLIEKGGFGSGLFWADTEKRKYLAPIRV
jgi:hypothetical protein